MAIVHFYLKISLRAIGEAELDLTILVTHDHELSGWRVVKDAAK
jgi:hypothetical protein